MAKLQSSFMKLLSEEYLADLGRVVAAWAHVEHSFHLLYLSLVVMRGSPSGSLRNERVRNLMSLSLKRQIDKFRERLLDLELSDSKRLQIDKVLNKLDTLRNERDLVAHSQWDAVMDGNSLSTDKARSLSKSWKNFDDFEMKVISRGRLQDIFQRIEALYWDLHGLTLDRELRDQMPRQR